MKQLLLSLALALVGYHAEAQEKPQKIDTVFVKRGFLVIKEDTTFIAPSDTVIIGKRVRVREDPYVKSKKFYDSLQEKAEKSRITKELHELLIRKQRRGQTIDSVIIKSEDSFKRYDGLTVRSIKILKVDLLEGSVIDTAMHASSRIGKLVNRIHADTRDFIIRSNLLFREGDRVDPYRLADNERILRQFKTIRDARIYLRPVPGDPGQVDVVVVTQDVASVGASGSYSSFNKFSLDVYDINILGYAKQLTVSYFHNEDGSPADGYEVSLSEPNISGSFIRGEFRYTNNYLRERTLISAGRDFLTPKMKYAGGLEVFETKENYFINQNDTLATPYAQQSIDLWLGRAFSIASRTNIILSARAQDYRFKDRPFINTDSNYFFFDRNLYLGSVTLFHTNYFKGSLIRGFGKTEDVPVNSLASITFGREYNSFGNRTYVGLQAGAGRYYPSVGYINANVVMGGFARGTKWEDGVVDLNATYFSNLIRAGKAQIRQFVDFSYVTGYHRTVYRSLSVGNGWKDTHGFIPLGDERVTLGCETVYFTPWYVYGFKFAVYHGLDVHLLTAGPELLSKENVFPAIRAGMRMLNDNLVFPTLSLDLNYNVKKHGYNSSFGIAVSTSLPRLFGSPQSFKPAIAAFR